MKIAYVIKSMYGGGGMERVISCKANYLADILAYDVTIITYAQHSKPYYFELSKTIKCIDVDLGEDDEKIRHLSPKFLKQKLQQVLCSEKFDICISTYGLEAYALPHINDGSKKIIEFHFCFYVKFRYEAIHHPGFYGKLLALLMTIRMIFTARHYDKIIVLTKADLNIWKRYSKKVYQIYNPITIDNDGITSSCTNKIVIAVGRLAPEKGYDYLIQSWRIIAKKHTDWILQIYGSGEQRPYLELIKKFNLEKNILLMGDTNEISIAYYSASIFVLSSRYEGCPLVITEAMSKGLPIVSYDCPYGPSELVVNKKNGYLIEKVGDIEKLADCLCYLINDETIRKKMGQNSKEMFRKLDMEKIMNRWNNLFNGLLLS